MLSNIQKDPSTGAYPTGLGKGGVLFEDVKVTMDYFSDTLPSGRKKFVHSIGLVGAVEF